MGQTQVSKTKKVTFLDKVGILISSLCLIHCLLLPVLIIAFPTVASFLNLTEDRSHMFMILFLVPAAGFAIYSGYRMHGERSPMKWLFSGVALVVFGTFFVHDFLSHEWEYLFVILGSIALVRGHILNSHHCKKCEEEHHCIWEHGSEADDQHKH